MKFLKFLRFLIVSITTIIVLLTIVAVIAINNFDLNQYKSYASKIVEEQLGRKLIINGDAKIAISLIPTIQIFDVEFSNPTWAKNPEMVKIEKLEVQIALLPLLKKQIVVNKILLNGAVINLEINSSGDASWDFGNDSKAEIDSGTRTPVVESISKPVVDSEIATKSTGAKAKIKPEYALLAGLVVKNVEIMNAKVVYDDNGDKTSVDLNDVLFSAPSFYDEINLEYDVVYNEKKFKGSMLVGSATQFMKFNEPYPIILKTTAYGVDWDLKGGISNLKTSLTYNFDANVHNPSGNFDIPKSTLNANVSGGLNSVNLNIQELNMAKNIIQGDVFVDWSKSKPFIRANLSSPKIDLQSFDGAKNVALILPSIISSANASKLVPDVLIPYKELFILNASANIKIGELTIAPPIVANNVALNFSLHNGILKSTKINLNFADGSVNADMQVDAKKQTVMLKLNSEKMLLQSLHKEFMVNNPKDFGVISGGDVDLSINVASSGDTYRKLAQNIHGQAITIVGKSVVQTGGLNFMTGNFISQLVKILSLKSNKVVNVDLNCAVIRSDIANGRAVFPNGIAVSSKQLTIVSDGNINLINDKIKFSLSPFSGDLLDTNVAQAFTSFIEIKGTLENPKIRVDEKETLKAIVGVVATGGTSYVGSKLLLDADGSPCYTALVGTKFEKRFPKAKGVKAVGQDVYKGTTKVIDKNIDVLKKSAKDFLNSFKNLKF